MCKAKVAPEECKMRNRKALGQATRNVLAQALVERRLISGLLPSITFLGQSPDNVLMCLLPEIKPGDAATHMQTVLLQAFCYENYIPVILVDNPEKLAECCGFPLSRKPTSGCLCAIITRDLGVPINLNLDPPLSPDEQKLTDFYECTLEEYPKPVIHLPR